MGIALIDTETVHEVTVGETIFSVRALDAYDRLKMSSIMAKLAAGVEGFNLTRSDWDGLITILDGRVVEIQGYPDKLATLKAMNERDIVELSAKIFQLSTLPEADRKNS